MLQAAHRLFLERGYSATTMPAVAAAATDPKAAGVWQQLQDDRLAGLTIFARPLGAEGHLPVLQRGWTPERYGRWVAGTLIAALLP